MPIICTTRRKEVAAMAVSPLVYELHAADMRATQQEQQKEAGTCNEK